MWNGRGVRGSSHKLITNHLYFMNHKKKIKSILIILLPGHPGTVLGPSNNFPLLGLNTDHCINMIKKYVVENHSIYLHQYKR